MVTYLSRGLAFRLLYFAWWTTHISCVSKSLAKKSVSCSSYNLFPSTGSREGCESSDKRWTRSCKNIVYSIWSARSSFGYAMQTTNSAFVTFGGFSFPALQLRVLFTLALTAAWCFVQKQMQEPCVLLPESLLQSGRSGVAAIDLRYLAYYCFIHLSWQSRLSYTWSLIFDDSVYFCCRLHRPFFSYTCIALWIQFFVSKSCCFDNAMLWSK